MSNKTLLFFCIIFFLLNSSVSGKNVSVEVTGISIVSDSIAKAKKEAFKDAFKKAVNKVLNNYLTSDNASIISDNIKNPEKYIDGYEILDESQNGNIFNVKLKVFVNLRYILKKTDKNFSTKPVYILSVCLKDNATFDMDSVCSDILKNNLSLVPNSTSVLPSENLTDKESLFAQIKDILVIATYNITFKRKVYSIDKEFDNLTFHIDIYDSNNVLLKTFDKKLKILAKIGENPLKYLPDNFFRDTVNYISKKSEQIASENNNIGKIDDNSFFFVIKKPKNYIEAENILKLFDNYNVNYSFSIAENGNLIYIVKDISKKELLKILKFSNLNFASIKLDDNITITFH